MAIRVFLVLALGLVSDHCVNAQCTTNTEETNLLQARQQRWPEDSWMWLGNGRGRRGDIESSVFEPITDDTIVNDTVMTSFTSAMGAGLSCDLSVALSSAKLANGLDAGYSVTGGQCSGHGGPGGSPSTCCFKWASEVSVLAQWRLPTITEGATIAIKGDVYIKVCLWGYCTWKSMAQRDITCPACGGKCSIDATFGPFVFDQISFDMPACPIENPTGGSLYAHALPEDSPFGVVSVKGDFSHGTLRNGDGTLIISDVSFTATAGGITQSMWSK